MTPERLDQIPFDAKQEIERLQAELAEKECTCGSGAHPRRCLRHPQGFDLHVAQLNYEGAQDTIQELQKELAQAKSQQVHCLACGGVECHRLAEIVKLTGMESDQHLVEWVERAKAADCLNCGRPAFRKLVVYEP